MTAQAGSPAPAWPDVLSSLLRGRDLDAADAAWAMGQVMAGDATPSQVAGFVVALRAKGETVEEVSGIAEAMLGFAAPCPVRGPALDVVGTGGDRSNTVNISTMAAIAVAASGQVVVKHGNRAASSACGAADLLEELGIPLDLAPATVAALAGEVGITFCFAPVFHSSMRHAASTRRELGIPTVFNVLGPLTNPARPSALAVGCADPRVAGLVAGVLAGRGLSALVFRGDDGLDELTTTTTSRVWVVGDGVVSETTFDPASVGIAAAPASALVGGDAAHNAAVARRFLAGEKGPVRDAVLLNAAAARVAASGAVRGGVPAHGGAGRLEDAMAQALTVVGAAVDSGAAQDLLDRWVTAARAHRPS